jgi:ABC-type multidrug transport system permease subunit
LFGYLNLGNQTVEFLKKDSFLNIHEFNNLESAINSVKEGKNWGVLYIDREFSKAFFWKYYSTKNETIQKDSTMDLYLDLSDYQISLVIGERLQKAFEDSVMKFTNASVNPIKIMKPIYGKRDSKFSTFLAPGVIAVIAFSHSIGLTAIAFIREKMESTMDRIFASGVKVPIIIIAHFVTHSIILFIQVALLFAIAIFAFKIPLEGYFVTAFTLLLFLGLVGMSLGLVISSISYQEMEAIQISLACVFPSLLMSGILWPKEAIPSSFQWVSNSLPTTWTASALRSIMIRGWNIQHKEIYYSYFISLAWIISLLFFASWRLNSRDKQKKWWFFKQKKQISPINLPLINENISVDRD